MAAMVARGGNQLSSSISVQEEGSRHKRKFRADPPLGDPSKLSSAHIECSDYVFSGENSQSNLGLEQRGVCELCSLHQDQLDVFKSDIVSSDAQGSSDLVYERSREELELEEFQDADWSDLTETQLEELVLSNLNTIFKSAIKRISSFGYSEEVAMKAVLRSGLCYGCKDTGSNIVDNTLAFLRNGQEIDSSREHFFEDLQQLEKYLLAEMVCVLREVRPFFSTGDAMWCLLICDMNVSHACAMDGDSLSSFGNDEMVGSSSVPTIPQLKAEANTSLPSMPLRNIPRSDKPNTLLPYPQCSQSEIPSVAGIPNLPPTRFSTSSNTSDVVSNPANPPATEEQPPEKESPISSAKFVQERSPVAKECITTLSQTSVLEEKPSVSKKSHIHSSKRESILRQKSTHLEKNYRAYGAKGALRAGKVSGLSGLLLDRKSKSVSDSNSTNLKNASLNLSRTIGVDSSQPDGSTNLSLNTGFSADLGFSSKPISNSSALPVANTELSLSLPSKGNSAFKPNCNFKTPSCSLPGIATDKIFGQWLPQDNKDEVLLKLVPRVRELQTQLQEWKEWAQQKVMQAARRLSKDKAELKTLRQEKEEVARLKKEKQILEENTMKKLSEMENALCKASGQVERANAAVRRLELENSELRQEMEAAKLRAAESAASYQEVSRREKKTLKKFQSWERQKALFQEELATEKWKLSQLQQQLKQAKGFQDQLEARWKQEEKVKEDALMQSTCERKEKEQVGASAKSKEDMIRIKAESDFQKYRDDIRRLEKEIAQLRLKTDSSKIAALRWGIDGSYASRMAEGRSNSAVKETNINCSFEMADFQESGMGDVQRERECVMCLTEERSVVFLPCAHQVVCKKCNELHEKQGMKDCPSCRTPIQRRICVRSADS